MLGLVIKDIDYIAMDVKCSLRRYPELVGYDNFKNIEESLQIIKSSLVSYELRTTIIESFHSEEEIKEMLPLLRGAKKYKMQAFVPKPELLNPKFCKLPRTSKLHIEKLARIVAESQNAERTAGLTSKSSFFQQIA